MQGKASPSLRCASGSCPRAGSLNLPVLDLRRPLDRRRLPRRRPAVRQTVLRDRPRRLHGQRHVPVGVVAPVVQRVRGDEHERSRCKHTPPLHPVCWYPLSGDILNPGDGQAILEPFNISAAVICGPFPAARRWTIAEKTALVCPRFAVRRGATCRLNPGHFGSHQAEHT